ncbi:MAG: hypothetical protein JRI80_00115 [Deltaproteobacteria bacterium]|nr:hypothetical protein [Deltaproteobacteria bacterium]
MAELPWEHTTTGLALNVQMDRSGEDIPKDYAGGINDHARSLGRNYSGGMTHAHDTGIDETDPDALGLNIVRITETIAEVPWPGSPMQVSNAGSGAAVELNPELPFTKFLQPAIKGTQDSLVIIASNAPLTVASDAGIDESFRKTNLKKGVLLGGVDTIYNFHCKSQLLAASQFTIILAGAAAYAPGVYKLKSIRHEYDPANPDNVEYTLDRFTANTEAGPVGHVAHMIDILQASHVPPVEDVSSGLPAKADLIIGTTADWTTAAGESEIGSAAALTADSAYLVTRTRTLSIDGPAEESYSLIVWPTGDCVDPT